MILNKLLLIVAIVGAVAALLNMAGASLYEIKQVKLRRQQASQPYARRYRYRPLVSVIVASQNNESTIADCLDSLVKSSYRKWEIIVADNVSRDGTKQIVRRFMAAHPSKPISLYARRQSAAKSQLLAYVYKKYVQGELIMRLNGDELVDKQAVARAVQHFNAEPFSLTSLNQKIKRGMTTAGLLQEFGLLLRNRTKKATSQFNADYFSSQNAAVYTRQALSELLKAGWPISPLLTLGDKQIRAGYASDVLVYSPTLSFYDLAKQVYSGQLNRSRLLVHASRLFFKKPSNYSAFMAWVALPFTILLGLAALSLPVFLSYFSYLALKLHQPAFLVLSWVLVSLLLLFSIWDDEHLRLWQKLMYVALIPVTYGWFYCVLIMQYLALLASLASFRASKSSLKT